MKKNIYILMAVCISACALLSSCEVDNYAAPDGTLTGKVIDEITGNGYISQQPNGFKLRCEELTFSDLTDTNPVEFWGKEDGTFTNTKMFAGKFRVTPMYGAFVKPAAQEVEITSGGKAEVTFRVTPLISFSNVSIVKDGNGIKATFRMKKNVAAANPVNYRLFVTSLTPHAGATDGTFEAAVSSSAVTFTDADLDKDLTVKISNSSFVAGRKYYARIGALCSHPDNSNSRYNLSEITTLQF